MYKLLVHPQALDDLATIEAESPDDYDNLIVLLEEIKDDPSLVGQLGTDGVFVSTSFEIDVTPIVHMQRKHFDLWRIKAYDNGGDLVPYRIIYAQHNLRFDFHVLAVMKRIKGKDYENDPGLTARLRKIYLDLKLPFAPPGGRH